MATNTGKGYRKGAIKHRVQIRNPHNNRWAKVNTETDKIIDQKADDKPFKNVAKYKDDRLS